MYVRAEGGPAGAAAAFHTLEGQLASLRGRKFFGTFHAGEYRACVQRRDDDDPQALGLETWTIPGGLFLRRRLEGGPENIATTIAAMAETALKDTSRPVIEIYKRENEVILLLPVTG